MIRLALQRLPAADLGRSGELFRPERSPEGHFPVGNRPIIRIFIPKNPADLLDDLGGFTACTAFICANPDFIPYRTPFRRCHPAGD